MLTISSSASGTILAGLANQPNTSGSNLQQFDGSTWSDLGPPLDGSVRAILPLSNGDVIAGGDFVNAGTVAVNQIARFSGGQWQPLATGLNGQVHALTRLPNGTIIAGGQFSFAGQTAVANIALWNGRWWPLDRGLSQRVNALVTMPDGSIIAGGSFTSTGSFSSQLNRVARWANNSWQQVGNGFNGTVTSLFLRGNRLVATGEFTASGTTPLNRIAEWDGTAWIPFTTGISNGTATGPSPAISGMAVAILPNQDVLVGGAFEVAGGLPSDSLAWWRVCIAEFNCDGTTDFFDYLDFVQAVSDNDPRADVEGDGNVDFFDYLDFVRQFSGGC